MAKHRSKSKRKTQPRKRDTGLNTGIGILTFICLAFFVSIIHKNLRGGTKFTDTGYPTTIPQLITASYEESILSSIELEILNGCGVKGVAQQFTDYLRSHHLDVVSTENADHFDYPKTIIIQRSQFIESSYRVAELLNIPKSDTTRILLQPDLSMHTDVTLIIGHDYNTIKPFLTFLKTQL